MKNSENSPKNKRTVFKWTDSEFQVSLLSLVIFMGFTITVPFVFAFYFILSNLKNALGQIQNMGADQIQQFFQNEMDLTLKSMVLVLFINVVTILIFSFLFSNRISGVLLRINNALKTWLSGAPVAQIIPRKGDFFTELVETVNEVTRQKRND